MHGTSALPLILIALGGVVAIGAASVVVWREESRRAVELDRRRAAGGSGIDAPTYPGSPLYGGHAAPATCHSHGDGGFSCSSDGGSDGSGGGGD